MVTYRRSRIELLVDVLRAIYKGRRSPSRVVYAARLSYDRVVKYITFLEEQGLVQRLEGQKKRYEITGRGADVIKYFDEIETNLFYKKPVVSKIKINFLQ